MPLCQVAPHTINHVFEDYIALADHIQRYNIRGVEDLWLYTVRAVCFLRNRGSLVQEPQE
jgi:hypothetical protein